MPPERAVPRLIALDWGTTSLRTYLLGDGGVVLARRAEPLGILQTPGRDFAGALRTVTEGWTNRDTGLPMIASGMIGSAQGWIEAPYVDVPADAEAVARRVVSEPASGMMIVPGLAQRGASPDVMRGEETQLFGAMTRSPALTRAGRVVLPGTHSKWARVENGRIEGFTTFMTGELFAVLRAHSILGRLADPGSPAAAAGGPAFLRGVEAARQTTDGLAACLFSSRAAVLVGGLHASSSLEYLSGLLIGDEVRCGLSSGEAPRWIVGEPALCERYLVTLAAFGVGDVEVLGDTSPDGLWNIGRRALPELQRADGSSRRPISGRDSLG